MIATLSLHSTEKLSLHFQEPNTTLPDTRSLHFVAHGGNITIGTLYRASSHPLSVCFMFRTNKYILRNRHKVVICFTESTRGLLRTCILSSLTKAPDAIVCSPCTWHLRFCNALQSLRPRSKLTCGGSNKKLCMLNAMPSATSVPL